MCARFDHATTFLLPKIYFKGREMMFVSEIRASTSTLNQHLTTHNVGRAFRSGFAASISLVFLWTAGDHGKSRKRN